MGKGASPHRRDKWLGVRKARRCWARVGEQTEGRAWATGAWAPLFVAGVPQALRVRELQPTPKKQSSINTNDLAHALERSCETIPFGPAAKGKKRWVVRPFKQAKPRPVYYPYRMSRGLGFVITLLNVAVWVYFHRRLVSLVPKHARRLRWVSVAAFVVAFHPALVLVLAGRPGLLMLRRSSPSFISMVAMALQFAAWVSLVGLLCLTLGRLLVRLVRRLKASPAVAPFTGRPERRRFMAQAALLIPAGALTTSAAGVWASRQTPVVSRVQLPVRREFTNLHGLKLAQVSDVHVGSYMDAARLDEISRVMNALHADVHVITGDLLDNDISQLELATRFIKSLRPSRADVFACMGNHEYIAARTADVPAVIQGLRGTGAQLLIDDVQDLVFGGDRLWMAGINHPPGRSRPEGRSTQASLQHVLTQMKDDGAPRVLLSHHPRTFIEARELPIDLMLSGHTHGGQIKLGRVGDYALTPMLPVDFYHNGLYEHHGRRLYVNAGAGGWLPVRLNCPPEITLVELVPA